MFPSPCGDYGSYPLQADANELFASLFPSPCGDYGSYRCFDDADRVVVEDCFRPLAGIMVLIKGPEGRGRNSSPTGFRPLAGIMVLITGNRHTDETSLVKRVSVPLRGLWFLSNQTVNCST